MATEEEQQRAYYARTAASYDAMHLHAGDEHTFALGVLAGLLEFYKVTSVLDVGAGSGRAVRYLLNHRPDVRVVGIEPVAELRQQGHAAGLSPEQLVEGNALSLAYPDGAFDVVCAFGVLHHVREPERAIGEMLRVARTAVFISDSNNFGQGSAPMRAFKQLLRAARLWTLADLVKTRGKGYSITEGDGLAYSYSLFDNYAQIRRACDRVHLMNSAPAGINPYRTAGHVVLLGVKRRPGG